MDTLFSSGSIEAIKGGAIMSAACVLAYVLIGKLIGMSSILAAFAKCFIDSFFKSKVALLSGIMFATGLIYLFSDLQHKYQSANRQKPEVYLVAGFLVGFGTRMAGGCTSGHGLLGLPRLSPKSIVAVVTFLSVAILTATFHLENYIPSIGLDALNVNFLGKFDNETLAKLLIGVALLTLLFSIVPIQNELPVPTLIERSILFVSGGIFALGLLISGMVSRDKVHNFLNFKPTVGSWDPSLMFVMASGVLLNFIPFQFILNRYETIDVEKNHCLTSALRGKRVFHFLLKL